jgi:hypothetical protein
MLIAEWEQKRALRDLGALLVYDSEQKDVVVILLSSFLP